jgi:hypothetical protein
MKYLLAFFVLLIACKPASIMSKIQDKEPIIVLKKTSCKGKCPEYEVAIYKEGVAVLKGVKNFKYIGSYSKNIDKEKINFLIAEFEKADFFSFNDKYTSQKTDLPTTFITFSNKGNSKKIMDYSDAPKELNYLEKLIEEIANEDGWQLIEKSK